MPNAVEDAILLQAALTIAMPQMEPSHFASDGVRNGFDVVMNDAIQHVIQLRDSIKDGGGPEGSELAHLVLSAVQLAATMNNLHDGSPLHKNHPATWTNESMEFVLRTHRSRPFANGG